MTNENPSESHRTTAKIHVDGFDSNNDTNRIIDDLENEQFPEDIMTDVPDRLARREPGAKKRSQANNRLEHFKNSTTKIHGESIKQVAGDTTSFTKKRTETTNSSGTTSR